MTCKRPGHRKTGRRKLEVAVEPKLKNKGCPQGIGCAYGKRRGFICCHESQGHHLTGQQLAVHFHAICTKYLTSTIRFYAKLQEGLRKNFQGSYGDGSVGVGVST